VDRLPADLVGAQIRAVVEDIPPHAAKTGALGCRGVVEAVAAAIADFSFPLVVDPVMVSKHGARLMDQDAYHALIERLIPHAFLLMPNLDEAAILAGFTVDDRESMIRAAEKLASLGAANVLIKGGHLRGDALDILYTSERQIREFSAPRIDTRHTHGSGCTYSAAVTAALSLGCTLADAVARAKEFVTAAIRTNPGLGAGSGPLNHHA
jgi:hydroxymethylpyrimidine/phosphomethylpyrimidine kinase